MSAALKACGDYYARYSTPVMLDDTRFPDEIKAGEIKSGPDPWVDGITLAETLIVSFEDLGVETPKDGWVWTEETHGDVKQAITLMLHSLEIMKRVHEREDPRFSKWAEAHEAAEEAARSNVVPIRGRRALPA